MADIWVSLWKDCDCITALRVDEPDHAKDVARHVAESIRDGHRVSKVTHEQLRAMPMHCEKHPKGTPPPWELERIAKGLRERVECPDCFRMVAATKAGWIMNHNRRWGSYRSPLLCPGSGKSVVPA